MIHLVLTVLHGFVVPQALLVPHDRVISLVIMVSLDLIFLVVLVVAREFFCSLDLTSCPWFL